MKILPIKAFEFANFFEKNWFTWKMDSLIEVRGLFEAQEEEKEAAEEKGVAGSGRVSKAGYLFSGVDRHLNPPPGKSWEDIHSDWRFISQFDPKHKWAAILWRFNEALKLLHDRREEQGGKIPTDMDYTFTPLWLPLGEEEKTKEKIPTGKKKFVRYYPVDPHPHDPSKKSIYLGLSSLVRELEKPVARSKEMLEYLKKIHGNEFDLGDVPLDAIDPHQHDPTHPEYRGHYQAGDKHYDLTKLIRYTDEQIDAIKDADIIVPAEFQHLPITDKRRQAAIEKVRRSMKKHAYDTFAGFVTLKPIIAMKHASNWITGVGTGILGNKRPRRAVAKNKKGEEVFKTVYDPLPHPEEIMDPNTGEMKPVTIKRGDEIKEMNKRWPHFTGHGKVKLRGKKRAAGAASRKAHVDHAKEMEDLRGDPDLYKVNLLEWISLFEATEPARYTRTKPDGTQEEIVNDRIDFELPTFRRKVKYDHVEKYPDGGEEAGNEHDEEIDVPILYSGKIVPRISIPDEMLIAIAKNTGWDPQEPRIQKRIPKKYRNLNLEELLKTSRGKSIIKSGLGLDDFQGIMNWWSMIPEEQREYIRTHQHDHLHRAAHEHGTHKIPQTARANSMHAGGIDVTKGAKPVMGYLDEKHMDKIIKKYLPMLQGEALNTIHNFIQQNLPYEKREPLQPVAQHLKGFAPEEEIEKASRLQTGRKRQRAEPIPELALAVIENRQEDLANIAAWLNLANLQSHAQGIHDPSVGLVMPPKDLNPIVAQNHRVINIKKFLEQFTQKGVGDLVARRMRGIIEKITPGQIVPAKGKEGEEISPEEQMGAGKGVKEEDVEKKVREGAYDPRRRVLVPGIISKAWLGDVLGKGFATIRREVSDRLGNLALHLVDRAAEKVALEAEAIVKLYKNRVAKLQRQGYTGNIDEEAKRLAKRDITSYLKNKYKDLFAKVHEKHWEKLDWEHALNTPDDVENYANTITKGEDDKREKVIADFVKELVKDGYARIPQLSAGKYTDSGPIFNLANHIPEPVLEDAQSVVRKVYTLLKSLSDEQIASKYTLPIVQKAYQQHEVEMPQEEVRKALQALTPVAATTSPPSAVPKPPRQRRKPATPVAAPPAAAPAMAARDIQDLISDLPKSVEELQRRRNELTNRPDLIARIKHEREMAQLTGNEELVRKIGEILGQ